MKIKATHRLLDSVWTVTANISINTATIVAYSRDDEDGYRLEDSLPKCQLTEGNGRVVKSLEIEWGVTAEGTPSITRNTSFRTGSPSDESQRETGRNALRGVTGIHLVPTPLGNQQESTMFDDLATPDITKLPTKQAGHKCPRCRGTGRYTYADGNTYRCGKCRGTGLLKMSPEQRIKARAYSAKAAIRRKDENVEEFGKREPAALAWLTSNKGDFAASLLEQVRKRGDLSPKQLQAVYQSIAQEADWAKQREQKATQTQIDMTDLLDRFALALKAGIKRPKVNTGDLLFSLAPAHGHNAGCVYVKGEKDAYGDRTYLGKITPQGKFFAGRDVEDDVKQRIAEVGSDVVGSAKAHGAQHNNCCFCSRDLTTDESVSNGYGPICAERYGLPWVVTDEFKKAKAELKQANEEAAS